MNSNSGGLLLGDFSPSRTLSKGSHSRSRRLFAAILSTSLLFSIPSQAASIIYADTFTGTNGTPIDGRAVETNNGVAGATYFRNNPGWTSDLQGNQLRLGADSAASLNVQSSGLFVQPQRMDISATLSVGTISGPTTPSNTGIQRGVGLGFFTGTGGVSSAADFRGLFLGTDGRLILARENVAGSNRAGFLAQIATGINTAIPHNVSFAIDTLTGDIFDIKLDSILQPDIATTIFNSGINRVGFSSSSAAGNTYGFFDNFTLMSVPEPSRSLLPALGVMSLLLRRKRTSNG